MAAEGLQKPPGIGDNHPQDFFPAAGTLSAASRQSPTIQTGRSKASQMTCFRNFAKEVVNPLFIWSMDPAYEKTAKWTLFDLQAKLQQSGWMVPAYTMPANIEQLIVMRIVVRQGMSRDMADMLMGDIRNAVEEFEKLRYPTQSRLLFEKNEKQKGKVYTH